VLLHEMLHAYRAMQGRGYRLPLIGGMAGYENLEEYFAIVVTNIYISDPTNTTPNRTLRANHGGFTPLPASQSTSGGFLGVKSNERLIAQFVSKMPELCVALRDVEATFNPIREYLSPASKPPSRNKPGGI
jgi:hypothetical protein